jgi:hypothetical protein
MQILTETPTEDGQYVMIWGIERLWCQQIRMLDGQMTKRISSIESASDEGNWMPRERQETHDRTWPKTFLKL